MKNYFLLFLCNSNCISEECKTQIIRLYVRTPTLIQYRQVIVWCQPQGCKVMYANMDVSQHASLTCRARKFFWKTPLLAPPPCPPFPKKHLRDKEENLQIKAVINKPRVPYTQKFGFTSFALLYEVSSLIIKFGSPSFRHSLWAPSRLQRYLPIRNRLLAGH